MLYALILGFVVFVLVGLLHGLWHGIIHVIHRLPGWLSRVKNLKCDSLLEVLRGFLSSKLIQLQGVTIRIKQWFTDLLKFFRRFLKFFRGLKLQRITIVTIKEWCITFSGVFSNFFKNQELQRFLYILLVDLVIGVAMASVFLFWLHSYSFLADPEDASMDFVMKLNQCDSNPVRDPKNLCNFTKKDENVPATITLLDIDDETYIKWGNLPITPRDRILELIDSATRNSAKVIVVDVLLTNRIPYDLAKEQEYDKELYNYLYNYAEKYCSNGKKCPTIILIRDLFQQGGSENTFDVNEQPVYQVRRSFLDKAVEHSSPHIQWASSIFLTSTFDNVMRRWWLWLPVCEDNKPQIIPSVHLLVSAIVSHKSDSVRESLKELGCKLDNFVEHDCSNPYYEPLPLREPVSLSEIVEIRKGEVAGGGIRQRIMFTMPWLADQTEKCDTTKCDSKRFAFHNQGGEEIITVFHAFRYLKQMNGPQANLLTGSIKNSIVIIGSSHSDAQDTYRTPLGKMPGEFVIANAIYSILLNHGEIKETSKLKILLYKSWLIIVFVAMASLINMFIFTKLSRSLRYWRIVIVILVTTMEWLALQTLVSAELLKEGIWFDFSIPLVAILFHHIASQFQESEQENGEGNCEQQHRKSQTDVRETGKCEN